MQVEHDVVSVRISAFGVVHHERGRIKNVMPGEVWVEGREFPFDPASGKAIQRGRPPSKVEITILFDGGTMAQIEEEAKKV